MLALSTKCTSQFVISHLWLKVSPDIRITFVKWNISTLSRKKIFVLVAAHPSGQNVLPRRKKMRDNKKRYNRQDRNQFSKFGLILCTIDVTTAILLAAYAPEACCMGKMC